MKQTMAVALMSFMLVIGACGGGDTRLSKDEFLKQGNVICAAGTKAIDNAFSKAFPTGTPDPDATTIAKFFKETFAPLAKKLVDDLDALKPPQDLQTQVDATIAHFRAAVDSVLKRAETDPLAIANNPFTEVNREAGVIGLTECDNNDNNSS